MPLNLISDQALSDSDRAVFSSVKSIDGKHGKPLHKSFDCSIMDLADDIGFGVHDLEDALALKLIRTDAFEHHVPPEACKPYLDLLKARYPEESGNDVYGGLINMLWGDGRERKHAISRLVGYFVMNCAIETIEELEEPLIRYRTDMSSEAKRFLEALKKLVYEEVIRSAAV